MPQFNSPLCFKSYNFLKNLFSQREYCSRNYVPNEINHDSLKWSSIIFDDALPSPRHPHHAAKFIGCVPPESGSTIFQAWWWDVYNPQLEFTLESRQLNQRRMAQIKVSTYSSVVAHKGRHVSQITVARLIVDKNSTLYVWERCFVCCKAKHTHTNWILFRKIIATNYFNHLMPSNSLLSGIRWRVLLDRGTIFSALIANWAMS